LHACFAVGLGFVAYIVVAQWTIARADGIPMGRLAMRCVPPLLACIPMVAAVFGVRQLLALGHVIPAVALPIEVVAGVLGFVVGAFTLARGTTLEFLALVREARARR